MTTQQSIQIIQGGAISFTVRITDGSTGDPYDLTSVTAITTCFHNTDNTELMLGLGTGITIVSAILGKISIAISNVQSALLVVVGNATLELTITNGASAPFKIQIPSAYSVIESVC